MNKYEECPYCSCPYDSEGEPNCSCDRVSDIYNEDD